MFYGSSNYITFAFISFFRWHMTYHLGKIKKDLFLSKSFMVHKWHMTKFRVHTVYGRSLNVFDSQGNYVWVIWGLKTVFSVLQWFYTKWSLTNCDLHHCDWTMNFPKQTWHNISWKSSARPKWEIIAYFISIVIKRYDRFSIIHDHYEFSQLYPFCYQNKTKRPAGK